MIRRIGCILICGGAVVGLLSVCLITMGTDSTDGRQSAGDTQPVHRYVTWAGYEADRYMAAWLIKRFIDPKAEFSFLPIGSEVPADGSIAFDVPGGRWFRGGRQSTAEIIFGEMNAEDAALECMVGMVRKLEMAYWLVDPMSDAGRMNSAIVRIASDKSGSVERLSQVFEYFDRIYAANGRVPE